MGYVIAESVTVDSDEGRITLEIEDVDGVRVTVNIHEIDLDAFYDQVKARIGPYLRERDEARAEYENARDRAGGWDPRAGYDLSDPKHPEFHSVHADIWDARDGK